MSLRSLERRLAPEICYEIVADVVDEYLSRSREEGRLLSPVDHLKMPILRSGFHPPGLHQAGQELELQLLRERRRANKSSKVETAPSEADSDDAFELPEADELIETIFWPYRVDGLRTHRQRQRRTYACSLQRYERRRRLRAEDLEDLIAGDKPT